MRKRFLPTFLLLLLSMCGLQGCKEHKLDTVFNEDMLGTNLRYFESVAGIPRRSFDYTYSQTHVFIVDGCTVEATEYKGVVTSLSLELNDSCHADLTSFLGEFAPKGPDPLTFGDFSELRFAASCLESCGNAYDPSVYAFWSGPRAVNNISIKLEASTASADALDASMQWAAAMKKSRDQDYIIDTKFNCDALFNDEAAELFESVKVSKITLGGDVDDDDILHRSCDEQ